MVDFFTSLFELFQSFIGEVRTFLRSFFDTLNTPAKPEHTVIIEDPNAEPAYQATEPHNTSDVVAETNTHATTEQPQVITAPSPEHSVDIESEDAENFAGHEVEIEEDYPLNTLLQRRVFF